MRKSPLATCIAMALAGSALEAKVRWHDQIRSRSMDKIVSWPWRYGVNYDKRN